MLLDKPPSILRDLLQVWGVQRPDHILRDAVRRVILHNKSGLAVYYNIRYRPDRRREHRGSAGHGLEHDVREPFGVGGEDEEPELVEVLRKVVVGDPAREFDAGGDSLFLQGGLDRLFQRPVPADECPESLLVAEDGGEGLGEVLDAFFPTQPADVADEGRSVRQGGGDGEGVEVEEVLVSDEDLVAVFFEVPFGDEGWGV